MDCKTDGEHSSVDSCTICFTVYNRQHHVQSRPENESTNSVVYSLYYVHCPSSTQISNCILLRMCRCLAS